MPWEECRVTRAGPAENGNIYIALQAASGAFHNWYIANSSMEKEMLAVALSAIAGDRTVTTHLASTTAYSTINRLYVRS
ncbi:MAG: hypothetical protein AB3N20_11660 [Rhizobiaceae bacterium]